MKEAGPENPEKGPHVPETGPDPVHVAATKNNSRVLKGGSILHTFITYAAVGAKMKVTPVPCEIRKRRRS